MLLHSLVHRATDYSGVDNIQTPLPILERSRKPVRGYNGAKAFRGVPENSSLISEVHDLCVLQSTSFWLGHDYAHKHMHSFSGPQTSCTHNAHSVQAQQGFAGGTTTWENFRAYKTTLAYRFYWTSFLDIEYSTALTKLLQFLKLQ